MTSQSQSRGGGAPILMSGPMVRATLEGRKCQTRRYAWADSHLAGLDFASEELEDFELRGWNVEKRGDLYYVSKPTKWQNTKPGDLLYVRETWRAEARNDSLKPKLIRPGSLVSYDADYDQEPNDGCRGKTRVSIHMPRWASRLTLEVTAVKVERLQEISREDVAAEGISERDGAPLTECVAGWHEPFADLWETINGPGSWEANPFVVAVSFTPHRQNIDQFTATRSHIGDAGK